MKTGTVTIQINNREPETIKGEKVGPFIIHSPVRGAAYGPLGKRCVSVTPACGWTVGTFKNRKIARDLAKTLAGLPGVDWNAKDPNAVFVSPEIKRSVYDVVKDYRL